MCCTSKKKTIQKPQKQVINQQPALRYEQNSKDHPVSKMVFLSNNYEPVPLSNQQNFATTKKPKLFPKDNVDRTWDYAQENKVSKEPRLLAPQELLSYDLDSIDGVTGNPTVDTFHYEAVLSHCFIHGNKQTNMYNKTNTFNNNNLQRGYSQSQNQNQMYSRNQTNLNQGFSFSNNQSFPPQNINYQKSSPYAQSSSTYQLNNLNNTYKNMHY